MNKFKTEKDVIDYFNTNDTKGEIDEQFKSGARWAAQMNEEYINHLLKRISTLNEKVQEQSERLAEYDSVYFGAEPPVSKRSRKKPKSSSQDETEREEMLAEMERMYGVQRDYEDEDDFFGFED